MRLRSVLSLLIEYSLLLRFMGLSLSSMSLQK
ncbi:hypothetical protein F383_00664 [Gossypium arboreum]|uniref:Uncharacterized protein n=1 Tax=Gossypium arboreum TaxID=29729 RepID=A0A0B0P1K8_GOSAR|nr:hypothetical protein F383_00664 [Gossypium arboreum]